MLAYKFVLHRPGQRALVTIGLSDPAPAGAAWIKYDAVNGWQDYSHHAAISADRRWVTVEVKDGGYGDADGVANGIILDPAGLYTAVGGSSTAPTADGGGGGGCLIRTIRNVEIGTETGHGPWQWVKLKWTNHFKGPVEQLVNWSSTKRASHAHPSKETETGLRTNRW